MPIRVQCSCGKSQFAPDATAGRSVLCLACRQQVPVPGSVPRSSRTGLVLVIGAALLVPAGFGYVFFSSRTRSSFVPVLEEYRNGSREPVDPALDRPKIEATIAKLIKASTDDNPEHFSWCFNPRRMLAEIELRGGLSAIGLKREETSLIDELDTAMRGICEKHRLDGTTWLSLKRCTVRFIEGRGEAEAAAVIRMKDSSLRLRFWLIKEKKEWGIYDFEGIDVGIRQSVLLARAMARSAKALQNLEKGVQQMERGEQLMEAGKHAEALQALSEAEALAAKSEFEPSIHLFQALAHFQLKQPQDALKRIDQALQLRKDMPLAYHVRGIILHALERYPECIQAQEEYLRMIGDDAAAFHGIGMAYEALGKPDKAKEAYEKGAAADESDIENRDRLKALQDARK